jgi:hypothetical protein
MDGVTELARMRGSGGIVIIASGSLEYRPSSVSRCRHLDRVAPAGVALADVKRLDLVGPVDVGPGRGAVAPGPP